MIRDAGSLNGTHIQGEILSGSSKLKPGDSFRIGELTFVVNFHLQGTQDYGLVGPTPRSQPIISALAGDSSSALAPPSSFDIIDLATLPGMEPPNLEGQSPPETGTTTPDEKK